MAWRLNHRCPTADATSTAAGGDRTVPRAEERRHAGQPRQAEQSKQSERPQHAVRPPKLKLTPLGTTDPPLLLMCEQEQRLLVTNNKTVAELSTRDGLIARCGSSPLQVDQPMVRASRICTAPVPPPAS